jgi:tRNA threonylcarbamoyladenosine biosynthesis protein TsaB
MLVLALDTCDARGSIAILRDGLLLASLRHDVPQDYSSWLLPATDRTLSAAQVRLPDVDLFAVAAGPGSFTALRVGMTTVKAWAEVYGRPVVPVSRLEALVEQIEQHGELVAAFVDARREQLYAGFFQGGAGGFTLLGEESVIAPEDFLANVANQANGKPVTWISLDPLALTRIPAWTDRVSLGESVILADPLVAPAIARIAIRKAAEGHTVDALALDANYIRRCDAELFTKGKSFHAK